MGLLRLEWQSTSGIPTWSLAGLDVGEKVNTIEACATSLLLLRTEWHMEVLEPLSC